MSLPLVLLPLGIAFELLVARGLSTTKADQLPSSSTSPPSVQLTSNSGTPLMNRMRPNSSTGLTTAPYKSQAGRRGPATRGDERAVVERMYCAAQSETSPT